MNCIYRLCQLWHESYRWLAVARLQFWSAVARISLASQLASQTQFPIPPCRLSPRSPCARSGNDWSPIWITKAISIIEQFSVLYTERNVLWLLKTIGRQLPKSLVDNWQISRLVKTEITLILFGFTDVLLWLFKHDLLFVEHWLVFCVEDWSAFFSNMWVGNVWASGLNDFWWLHDVED